MAGIAPPDGTKEIIEGVTEAIKQRLGSPILFGFIASWCLLNYQFLLVIFAEDPFIKKFKYVHDNIDIVFWKPVGIGILVALVLPLLEVPYRAFRGFCHNLELFAEMWVQRREPMDIERQAKAFRKKDLEIQKLKKEILSLDARCANIENEHVNAMEGRRRRISEFAIMYLAAHSQLDPIMVLNMLTQNHGTRDDKGHLIIALSKHAMLGHVIKYLGYVDGLIEHSEGKEIKIEDMRAQMSLQEPEFSQLQDLLVSICFIQPPVRGTSIYWNCPSNSHSFQVAAQMFRDAASVRQASQSSLA